MIDTELISKILKVKEQKGYTLHELSKILDIHITTIERWLKTQRINKVYAQWVKTRLFLD
jgi:transposase